MTQRNILVADPQHSRGAEMKGKPRTVVNVAVGILMRADGHYLLTTRPSDKDYGGYWEFPGGKLEIGETVEQALRRELQEEIGNTDILIVATGAQNPTIDKHLIQNKKPILTPNSPLSHIQSIYM